MKTKKLGLLVLVIFFFSNIYAGLLTHLKFENNLEDSYGDNNGEWDTFSWTKKKS